MRRELLVPKLGLTMTEGVLVEWLVKPGDRFTAGQGLFVIESEKAANEIGADADGLLLECTAEAGETLPCGAVIGHWDDGLAGETAMVAGKDHEPLKPQAPMSAPPSETQSQARSKSVSHPSAVRVPITPLARRLAEKLGVNVKSVVGSGPRGRIRARDVEAHAAHATQAAQESRDSVQSSTSMQSSAVTSESRGLWRAPNAWERATAQRLTQAKQQVPHFYLSLEAEVSQLITLRQQMNAAQQRRKFTLNHWVLAAVGQALESMPEVNRVWSEDGILSLVDSDVGMAVNTERGLLVPVLRRAGALSLGALAAQSDELIERAKAGRLSAADMSGGAITVSNAGMHDVTYLTSIINPGQAMILGVGSVREVFRPDEHGQPVIRREMGLVLSADHRVLDGVSGLKFLKRVVQGLQAPAGLLAV